MEKEKQEAADRKEEEEAEGHSQCAEDEMETIEEEGTIQRLTPTVCSEILFTFTHE